MSRTESRICIWHRDSSLSCTGIAVGLLRDNVAHFLERGGSGLRFRRLHALADVPWRTAPLHLEPKEFRLELMAGWAGVWQVPTRELVMGLKTRSLLPAPHGPLARSAEIPAWLARLGGIVAITTLGELVANLVHELSALAARADQVGPSEVIQCATAQLVTNRAVLREARPVSLGPSGLFLP